MVTPEFLQDSIQVTLRSSGGGYSRSGQPTCAHNPSQALSVLVNSGVSAPSCHRLLRVNSNEVPASSQVQQESWVSAEPLRPDGNSTQGMGTRGDSQDQRMFLPSLSKLVRVGVSCGQVDGPPSLCWNSGWCLLGRPFVTFIGVCLCIFSQAPLFANPWTITLQAPLSMRLSRQEYCSGLPFPSPGDLPNPGIEPGSPALQTDALPSEPPGKPSLSLQRV